MEASGGIMSKQAKSIYVLGLDMTGHWHLSMVETEKSLAAIRYADLKTVMIAVVATMNKGLADRIDGTHHKKAKQWVTKCAKKDKGIPLADVRATASTIHELGAGDDRRKLQFIEARGASLQPGGGYRPGLPFNYFKGPSSILYHTGLTAIQHKHMRAARALRVQAHLRENAIV